MKRIPASRIVIAVKQLATDADLCKMFSLTPEELERYRPVIDVAKAEAMVALKYQRAMVQAQRPPKGQQ